MTTLVWAPDVVFDRGRLLAALRGLDAVRIKGLFRTDEGTVLLQTAGGALSEEPSGRRSDRRVDVIARHGVDLRAAEAALEAARMRPRELVARGTAVEVALPDGSTRTFDRAALAGLAGGVDDVSTLIPKRAGAAARLGALLREVGAPADASAVVVAIDGYVTPPVPLSALDAAVLVHSLAGEALPADQGGPFRLLIPGDAGPGGPCANVKGVVRVAIRSSG